MIYVTKANGSRQPFRKEKVVRTCTRMRASRDVARKVANQVAKEAYDGISTKKVLKLIFKYLRKYRPGVGYQIDLREAIAILRPKPDFERFIAMLLEEYGFKVQSNRIIPGRWVDHEVDAVARKGKDTVYVEVKHHFNHHSFTGLSVFLRAWATFDDFRDGAKAGKTKVKFNKTLIVTNTKISDHAKKYANGKGIMHIGWRAPEGYGLERMIEDRKLYPITYLKSLDERDADKLGNADIILLKQLVETDVKVLSRRARIPSTRIKQYAQAAKKILAD